VRELGGAALHVVVAEELRGDDRPAKLDRELLPVRRLEPELRRLDEAREPVDRGGRIDPDCPSTDTIRMPAVRPACAAGDPGDRTRSR